MILILTKDGDPVTTEECEVCGNADRQPNELDRYPLRDLFEGEEIEVCWPCFLALLPPRPKGATVSDDEIPPWSRIERRPPPPAAMPRPVPRDIYLSKG